MANGNGPVDVLVIGAGASGGAFTWRLAGNLAHDDPFPCYKTAPGKQAPTSGIRPALTAGAGYRSEMRGRALKGTEPLKETAR